MLTTGPAKIEVTDEQLNELQKVYQSLQEDMHGMITDFFTPFEMMISEGVFVGESAESFSSFCSLVRSYLEVRSEISLSELQEAGYQLSNQIQAVESI
ncbi:hypothetical protein JCM19046_1712 [Bacillus sp. JCM 19046]|nr:hypothetical protein JCM19046_1712 [Bacillus sp. JCM 19046]